MAGEESREGGESGGWRGRAAPFLAALGPPLGTALIYFVAARLAVQMVSPYGYATAVWPAAGLALASAIRFGNRVWPGVLLGAFAGNVGSDFNADHPLSTACSLTVAAIVAVGCTLQVVIGVRLVRRFVRQPCLLGDEADIWKFYLLAGPLASVVSATWANLTLQLAGLAPWSGFPIGWATWWVGDTIGVVVFGPLALILAESGEPWRRRRLPVGAALLVAFALVTTLFLQVSRWEQARVEYRLARRGEAIAYALDSQLAGTFHRVESVAALMSARPDTSRRELHVFVGREVDGTIGIQRLAWAPRVTHGERDALEDAARREGFPQFRIMEQGPQGDMVPAARREEHVVAYYVEPMKENQGILGFDFASEPLRLEAIRRAAATGRTAVTAPVRLFALAGDAHGVLVLSPAYDGGATPGGGPRVHGFGVGVLRIGDLVATALRRVHRKGLGLAIEDEAAPPGERLLYTDLQGVPARWWTVLDVGGRRWRVGVAPLSERAYRGAQWLPWAVHAAGLLFVGLLGILLLVLLGRATRVELLAAERARLVEELRGAVTLRDEFLAIAAHELRTPLTSLQLQLQLAGRILRAGGPADPAPRVEAAVRQAGRLGRLVDDLLNASRITAGRLTLTREECDLVEIVRDTITRHDEDARKAGCAIELTADGPVRGLWDCVRLEQVVTNLLTNALKFGAGKPIQVAVSADATSATLAVRDAGAGIPAEALERIFRKFERGVSARSYGGLGLGLFIAREIVAAHGGSLCAESAPGRGATLIMVLPRSPAPPGEPR